MCCRTVHSHWALPPNRGALRRSRFSEEKLAHRTVKDELRDNLLAKLKANEPLFPGALGFDDTVVPQMVKN